MTSPFTSATGILFSWAEDVVVKIIDELARNAAQQNERMNDIGNGSLTV
jgi:hypothetical protein